MTRPAAAARSILRLQLRELSMATLSLVITITGPPATTVTLTPVAPFTGSGSAFTAVAPIASGAVVGAISVQPAGWQGALSLSGADAAAFAVSGSNLVTAVAMAVRAYNVTINANP
jgi:hypothetical protein